MQVEKSDFGNELSNDAVFGYLTRHPEFFVNNQDILARLRIPHDAGKAVSLIEKQVSVLRGKCSHLENSLSDLIAVARQNELLYQRLHTLIQEIITASSLAEIVALTQGSLRENFNAEEVHILLIAAAPKRAPRKIKADAAAESASAPRARAARLAKVTGATVVRHTDKRIKHFSELFDDGQTLCGMPNTEQLTAMMGKEHANVGSAAMIPLHFERKLGVVMLTSRDESRFGATKGVMFLNQLGELLGRRIHSYTAHAQGSVK